MRKVTSIDNVEMYFDDDPITTDEPVFIIIKNAVIRDILTSDCLHNAYRIASCIVRGLARS